LLSLASLTGCWGGNREYYPVYGSVRYFGPEADMVPAQDAQGRPIEYVGQVVQHAKISFYQNNKLIGYAISDTRGNFRARHIVPDSDGNELALGLKPGTYHIGIVKLQLRRGNESSGSSDSIASLPKIYSNWQRSGLTITVEEPAPGQELDEPELIELNRVRLVLRHDADPTEQDAGKSGPVVSSSQN